MSRAKYTFPTRFNATNIAELSFVILLFSIAGTAFMALNEVRAGVIYATLMSLSFIVLFFKLQTSKDEDKPTSIIPIPFAKKFSLSVFFYVAGWIMPVIMTSLIALMSISVAPSLSLADFNTPLFTSEIVEDGQSLSVAELEDKMSTKIFNIVYVAGSDESIVYNWLAMLFGVVAGGIVFKMLGSKYNPMLAKVFAYGFSVFVFVISHVVNSTYSNPTMFIIAGAFLLISNISIYEFGVPLSFWIGFHQCNNFLYLMAVFGTTAVVKGLLSLAGLIMLGIGIICIYYLINNWDVVSKDVSGWLRA